MKLTNEQLIREAVECNHGAVGDLTRGKYEDHLAAVALIAIAAIIVLSSGQDSAAPGNPHINLDSGLTNGIAPASRTGIEPPELVEQSLQKAARAADCELRLRLPEEGRDHISPNAPEPRYKTSPPTSGDHVENNRRTVPIARPRLQSASCTPSSTAA